MHPHDRVLPLPNREDQESAFILGAALALHLLWVGHLPLSFSRAYLLGILYEGDLRCLTREFLQVHAPQLVNVIEIWRKPPSSRSPDKRAILSTEFINYFGLAVS